MNTIVFGEENDFPGFFVPRTGCAAQFRSTDIDAVARIISESKFLWQSHESALKRMIVRIAGLIGDR